ncbi:bifunctional WD40 repeat [Babesia duncani]|uniref:Cleavage stimulation factor 50 kDa subunit n=1 Tax=Babesia duncani TaxID=323732 RepID=A0AAD9UN60_9APIC|nr:bifunctional WD40 repeat [Babesia duncani]
MAQTVEPERLQFYEVVLQQLLDDGLDEAAESVKRHMKVEPNNLLRKDHLYDIFNKCAYLPQRVIANATCKNVSTKKKRAKLDALLMENPMVPPDDEYQYKIMAYNKYAEFTNYKPCRCVAQSSDKSLIAVGGADGSLHVTPLVNSNDPAFKRKPNTLCTSQMNGHQNQIDSVAFHPRRNILASGGADSNIVIHDISVSNGFIHSVAELQRIKDGFNIRSLKFHPCGDFLFCGTSNAIIRLYDVTTTQCFTAKETSHQHKGGGINDCDVNGSGSLLYTAGSDGSILFWDAKNMDLLHAMVGVHNGAPVTSVQCDVYDRLLLASSCDGATRLIDLRMRKELLLTNSKRKGVIRSYSRFLHNTRYFCTFSIVSEGRKSGSESLIYSVENGAIELDISKIVGKPAVWDAVACNDEMGIITVSEDTSCKMLAFYDPSL